MSKCGRYWEKHLGRGNSGEMLGSGHVAGMLEEQRGGLCGWHGENRREEEVREVGGGTLETAHLENSLGGLL